MSTCRALVLAAFGLRASTPDFIPDVTAADNCSAVTKTQSPPAGTLVGLGTNAVTIAVTDVSGNATNCTTFFVVEDATSPTIDPCPPDIATTVSAPTTSTVVTFATPAASDGCSTRERRVKTPCRCSRDST